MEKEVKIDITEAAKELHQFVKELVKPWTDFRGHEAGFEEILRKHKVSD